MLCRVLPKLGHNFENFFRLIIKVRVVKMVRVVSVVWVVNVAKVVMVVSGWSRQ